MQSLKRGLHRALLYPYGSFPASSSRPAADPDLLYQQRMPSARSGVQFCKAAAALKAERRSALSPVYSFGLAGQQHPAAVYLLLKDLLEFVLCDKPYLP